jgi:hypothetical protein
MRTKDQRPGDGHAAARGGLEPVAKDRPAMTGFDLELVVAGEFEPRVESEPHAAPRLVVADPACQRRPGWPRI